MADDPKVAPSYIESVALWIGENAGVMWEKAFRKHFSSLHEASPYATEKCAMKALDEIATERKRQVEVGFNAAHDDLHVRGEIIFDTSWGARVRLRTVDCTPRDHLVRAAAMIVAEIERQDRVTIGSLDRILTPFDKKATFENKSD